jgi:hypothetical protein
MHVKVTIGFGAMLIIGLLTCSTAFAAYEGPPWIFNNSFVKENVTVKSKGVGGLKLEDAKSGEAVECKVTDEGKIGVEGKGEVTTISASECKALKLCEEGTVTVKAVHLPWKTQLKETEGNIRDTDSGSGGAPGWQLECHVIGIKLTDECTGESSGAIENVSGGVDVIMESKSAHLNCSIGGTEAGVIAGTDLDENHGTEHVAVMHYLLITVSTTETRKLPGAPKTCEFTLITESCLVEIENHSAVPVKIKSKELIESAKTRYGVTTEGCTVGLRLAEQLPNGTVGGTCSDRLKPLVTPVAGWINIYKTQAESALALVIEGDAILTTY